VLRRDSGISAEAEFAVPADCSFFPPLLLVESMAQLGGIAAGQRQGEGGVLAALGRVELPDRVEAGTTFSVHARVIKQFSRLVLVQGEVRQGGRLVACATLTLALGAGL
jgi:3-hydroxyacyl-[acyl-carrier-protein] dehydratase